MSSEARHEWHRTRGARAARAGLPKGTRASFVADGWAPRFWREWSSGYDQAFAEMSDDQRREAAIGGSHS